jgi:hypothetical protein
MTPTPEQIKERWNNAETFARKVMILQSQGCTIFNEDKDAVGQFTIKNGNEILEAMGGGSSITWFENNIECDHGLFTPIEEWNAQFKDWKFTKPNSMEPLL